MSFYNVRPRYTPGSPGMVGSEVAERLARSESRSYQATREGTYGPEATEEARALGLARIVVHMEEKRGGWSCFDLLTQEEFRIPFAIKKGERVEVWTKDRGWVPGTVEVRKKTSELDVSVRIRGTCQHWCKLSCTMPHGEVIEVRRERVRLKSSVKTRRTV